jgi:hypothetical protein
MEPLVKEIFVIALKNVNTSIERDIKYPDDDNW